MTSLYAATPIGRTAGADWSVQWLLTDGLGTPADDVTAAMTPGSIDLDPDRAVSGQMAVGIDRPFRIRPYADFLMPVVTVTPHDGRDPETRPAGLYRMRRGPLDWLDIRGRGIVATGSVTLDDLTGTVRDVTLDNSYSVAAGVKYTDAATLILQGATLPGDQLIRVRLPDDPRTLPAPRTWAANTSLLAVAGDLLASIGCYTPWADDTGVLVSTPYRDLDRLSPDHTFRAGDGLEALAQIIEPPKTDTDDGGLRNKVTVIQEDQDPAKRYRSVVEVTDPRSPIHHNVIGIRPRTEIVSQYADQAAVTAYAQRLASQWSAVSESVTLLTHLDLSHPAHGLFALDLSGASLPGDDREWIDGRWQQSGVRHDLASGRTSVKGRRNQPFQLVAAGVL